MAVSVLACSSIAPSGAPQNFTATGLTETSVRLTWDLPARNLRNGDIVMYQITYHKLADAINEEDLNITDTFVDIVGLEMDTDYIFKIKAYTSRGAGPWSNRLHFRTFGRSECQNDSTLFHHASYCVVNFGLFQPQRCAPNALCCVQPFHTNLEG